MGDGEGPCDRLLVLNQKILDWLIKILIVGKAETAIRSGLVSRIGIMEYYLEQCHFGPVVFFLTGESK